VVTICQVLESRQTLRVGDLLVFGCHAGECVVEVGRRALQDQSVEVFGIFGSHTLRDGTAQRVAYADYVLERVATNFGVAQILHQSVENFDLKRQLHDLHWVWVIGESGTDLIVCKSGVSRSHGFIHVAVIRCNVPVGMIQRSSMSQDLKRGDFLRCCWIYRQTKFGINAISA